jgi:hypothetical protein
MDDKPPVTGRTRNVGLFLLSIPGAILLLRWLLR